MSKAKGRKEKDDPNTRRYKMIFKLYDEDKDGLVDFADEQVLYATVRVYSNAAKRCCS